MVAHNDGSVRCVSSKRIYEEAFGEDGIDPCVRLLDPNWLKRAIYRAICVRGEDEKKRSRKIVGINRAGYKKNIWPKRTINKDVFCHAVFF